jgi:phosphoribosylformylglycinamidine synthase
VTEGHEVVLLGETREELSGSEWAHVVHDHLGGLPPRVDLPAEYQLATLLIDASRSGLLTSAHDLADGGLAQALVEATLRAGVGATVRLADQDPFVALFSESAARAVVTVPADGVAQLLTMAEALGVPATPIGVTGGSTLEVEGWFDVPLDDLRGAWSATLPALLGEV